MIQKELNNENNEIRDMAFEIYKKHGFKDGNEFADWLEAEKKLGLRSREKHRKQTKYFLMAIVAILLVIVVILLCILFKQPAKMELSGKSMSDLKVMLLVLDAKPNEKVVAFGDTHFAYNSSALTLNAKTLLDEQAKVLKENPKTKVRMAGYTSASGSEESNQKLSEQRADAVRDYLVEKGVAKNRVSIIGYGKTKPALYEANPDDLDSKAAKQNMRVLFEIVVE
jgi:outer membrane protein OmpA-like peptidoglycan-associated protein